MSTESLAKSHLEVFEKMLAQSPGCLERGDLLRLFHDRLSLFRKEIISDCNDRLKELKREKEKIEIQLLSSSNLISIKSQPASLYSKEEEKTISLNTITAESVLDMPPPSSIVEESQPIEDSEYNPFEAEGAVKSAAENPAIPFEYIVPIRPSFSMKKPGRKIKELLEFAAAIYEVKTSKVIATFQRFVQPTINPTLTPEEVTKLGLTQEQVLAASKIETVLEEFDAFLKFHKLLDGKKFALLFCRHDPLAGKLMVEAKSKKITLKPYFDEYLNLRHIFIYIYNNKRAILNLQKLQKRLKRNPIDKVIYLLEDMMILLNLKFKDRYINNLDTVDNMVKIISKLKEKSFFFTTKLLFQANFVDSKEGVGAA